MNNKKIKNSDLSADIEMYFRQIIELSTLMLNDNCVSAINVLTLRELAEKGLDKIQELSLDYSCE